MSEWIRKTIHRDKDGVWIITEYSNFHTKEQYSRRETLLKIGDIKSDLIMWEAYLSELDVFEQKEGEDE